MTEVSGLLDFSVSFSMLSVSLGKCVFLNVSAAGCQVLDMEASF